MRTRLTALALGIGVLVATGAAAQSNWPQFRGESGGVAADDPMLPDTWGPDENVVWTFDVPGRSWSSLIVWGDHVFVLTVINVEGPEMPLQPVEAYRARSLGGAMTAADVLAAEDPLRWVLYDVDFDSGAVRWERTLHTTVPSETTHQKSSFAAETPVTDGEGVYIYLGDIGLFALDFDGTLAWSVPMEWLPRRGWGSAASPTLHDGRLFLVNDNEAQSFIAPPTTLRPERSCGGQIETSRRTGSPRLCGRTTYGPRSSRRGVAAFGRIASPASCSGS